MDDLCHATLNHRCRGTIAWMKQNTPDVKFLYTCCDGIGLVTSIKPNFLYGGFI